MKIILTIIAMLALSSCFLPEAEVELNPEVNYSRTPQQAPANSMWGAAAPAITPTPVLLKIEDGRPNKDYAGRRGFSFDSAVRISNDPKEVLYKHAKQMLGIHNYVPAVMPHVPKKLYVKLRQIDVDSRSDTFSGTLHCKSMIEIYAKNGVSEMKREYHGYAEKREFFYPSSAENGLLVNKSLSKALQQMHDDHELWEFMTRDNFNM